MLAMLCYLCRFYRYPGLSAFGNVFGKLGIIAI